jgi:hypothetical protein
MKGNDCGKTIDYCFASGCMIPMLKGYSSEIGAGKLANEKDVNNTFTS